MLEWRRVALALMVALITGCAAPTPPLPTGTAAGPTPAHTPAVAPAGRVTAMVFGSPEELEGYRELARLYMERHPGAAVEVITIPGRDDYHRRVAADFAAGRAADVLLLDYRRYTVYAARHLLAPVGPFLQASEALRAEDFYREALLPYYYGRDLMCLPRDLSGLVVYYNKALFDVAGVPYPTGDWDWAAFVATARALTRDVDGDGQTDVYGVGTEVSLAYATPFIWQNGGELVDNLLLPRLMEISEPPAVQAVKWFGDWQAAHRAAPDAAAEAAEPSEARFMRGQLAMFLNTRNGVGAYRPLAGLDWDVAPLPSNRGRRVNVLFSDGYCLNARAGDPGAAWRFIEFVSSTEAQLLLARSGHLLPARVAAAEAIAGADPAARPANDRLFLDTVKHLRPMPTLENWVELEIVVTDEIKNVFYGRRSAAEAMRLAALRAEEYLRFHIVN